MFGRSRFLSVLLVASLAAWSASMVGVAAALASAPTTSITSFNPTTAAPGDIVTIYGSGFGATEPANGLPFQDVTTFPQNTTENWGQSGNASTFVVDSWSDTKITFTVPVPSGNANQYRLQPGSTARFCIAANCNILSGVIQAPSGSFTNENLPINNTANPADYYDFTEHVGIAPDSDLRCSSNSVSGMDGGSGSNFYDADAGSHSLLHPDAGTPLSPGSTYTDSSSGVSYIWPNVPTCHYDLIDTGNSTQTILMPPNTGATAIGFMGQGAGGSYSANATITYADNSTSTASLNSGDWCGGTPGGQTLANSPKRSDGVICHVFQWADTVTTGKVVKSITIPTSSSGSSTGNMRIWTIALANGSQTFPWMQWNHPADITYGTALSATQLDATAPNVAGTFAYSANPSGTVLNAGPEQTLSATFTPSDTTHWVTGSTITTAITVTKANQSITFNAIPSHTYGDADFDPGATASSGLTVSYGASGNCSIVSGLVHLTGAGSCTVTASQSGNSDYNAAADQQQSFNIGQATLTVNAPNVGIPLGGAVPAFSPQYSGFVGSDNSSNLGTPPTCSSTAGSTGAVISTVPPYSYPITCASGSDANYTFTYNAGTLTINTDTMVYSGDTTLTDGATGTISATLTDAFTGNPISGKSVTLTLAPNLSSNQSCTTTTNDSGVAACTLSPVNVSSGLRGVSASFSGDSSYPATSTSAVVAVNDQPTDTLTYAGDTVMSNGAGANLSATLVDSNDVGISGRTITFILAPSQNAQQCSGTTDSSGLASCSISNVNEPTGSRTVLVTFAGDTYAANSVNAPVTVNSGIADILTYTGDTTMASGGSATLSATLKDGNGNPISGQSIDLTLAPAGVDQDCVATTNGSGLASCSISPVGAAPGSYNVVSSFAGGGGYPANQVSASVTVTAAAAAADTLSYTGPGSIVDQNDVVVSAKLVDASSNGIGGEPVTFAIAPGLSNQSCTATTDSSGSASCTIHDVASEDDGSRVLRVTFAGDGPYPANQIDTSVTVTAAKADSLSLTGPSTATNGSTVTFTATLTDPNNSNAPIVGDTVSFVLGPAQTTPATCSGTTNGTGTVTCTSTAPVSMADGARTVVLTFTGDGTYAFNQVTDVGAVAVSN